MFGTSLTHCVDKKLQLANLVDNSGNASGNTAKVYIPLQFGFAETQDQTLPLIALQYHEVKVNIEFQDAKKLLTNGVSAAHFT